LDFRHQIGLLSLGTDWSLESRDERIVTAPKSTKSEEATHTTRQALRVPGRGSQATVLGSTAAISAKLAGSKSGSISATDLRWESGPPWWTEGVSQARTDAFSKPGEATTRQAASPSFVGLSQGRRFLWDGQSPPRARSATKGDGAGTQRHSQPSAAPTTQLAFVGLSRTYFCPRCYCLQPRYLRLSLWPQANAKRTRQRFSRGTRFLYFLPKRSQARWGGQLSEALLPRDKPAQIVRRVA